MTHLDDDTLLKFALETLDAPDDRGVREHLSVCQPCRERGEKVQAEVGRLSGIAIRVGEVAAPPFPKRARFLPLAARAAAILVVGFLAGYMTAELSNPVRPNAVQQRLVPGSPATPATGYIPCQAVDIGAVGGLIQPSIQERRQ